MPHRSQSQRCGRPAGPLAPPTLLIDGVDPFAAPGQPLSLSCRPYRDATGRADGPPPLDALRRVLEQASLHG
jgi:hypothetical protein